MNTKHCRVTFVLVLMTITLTATTWAQSYKEVINASAPAVYPGSPFTADAEGSLYTSVANGGFSECIFYGCGAIYQWKPGSHRQPTMLYSFSGSTDGAGPSGSVVFDAQGNLYGAADYAGDFTNCGLGCGVIYKLTPTTSGLWTQTVLHTFEGGTDGISPISVVLDANGNIFGLTRDGGGNSCSGGQECGTLFELTPTSSGPWTETILHTFTGGSDGGIPLGSLALDAEGNLFGTTDAGGVVSTLCTVGCGTVFELSPTSGRGWTFTSLYAFDFSHGANPFGSLVIDATGNLFGTTYDGARKYSYCPGGCGVVFELSPTASGWKQTLLHSFSGAEGSNPQGGLAIDASGNLFGTTATGGNPRCTSGYQVGCGVVFELSPASGGHWIYNHLYVFQGYDGFYPNGNPLVDGAGNIFGITVEGGTGFGNMYELSPITH